MNNSIGIVNYGVSGNIHSIKKAIENAGGKVVIINKSDDFNNVDKIVIPGVGSFNNAMQALYDEGLLKPLCEAIKVKKTLGICLGMQILATIGFEFGKTKGLDVIQAEVRPMLVDAKVPHMGFNTIDVASDSPLLKNIENESFYFMHSYEVINYSDILALTEYSNHQFVSAISKNNLYGVQFHPEKSREAGIVLFKNFIAI